MSVSMQPDPAREVERLVELWDAICGRLVAAGHVGPDDLVVCEVWSHGGAVVVTDELGDSTAYAMQSDGRLFRFTCEGWEPVDDEECCA